jgi:hypothetical protein
VNPVDADRIGPGDKGDTVRIKPSGEDKIYEIETDLLRPWLNGRDIQRWQADWSGQHVILPYHIKEKNGELEVELYSREELKENLPLTWEYFKEHKEKLEGRESGKMEGQDDWYAFIYPKSHDRFEKPKVIGAEIAERAKFMNDEDGVWYFKTGYGLQLLDTHIDKTAFVAALLNSSALDFYIKHITSIKSGGYYKYTTHYLEPLPVSLGEDNVHETIEQIMQVKDLKNKLDRFPAAYLSNAEVVPKTLKMDSGHSSMDPEIQQRQDSGFNVVIGKRKKEDPIVVDTQEKAEFVRMALQGQKVKKGEEVEVLVPKSNQAVKDILQEYEDDEQRLEELPTVEELEEEINEIVYDLYGLEEEDVEVIEEFLETF